MDRTARMLDLGEWQWLIVEAGSGNAHLTPPDADSLLWVVRERDMPSGRLALLADRAGAAARAWLEAQHL